MDYLRVIETADNNRHLVVIQAVLAKDIYQDVASIFVEKDEKNQITVQVVGDEYIYGENYIIEPVYIYRPVIYDWFWVLLGYVGTRHTIGAIIHIGGIHTIALIHSCIGITVIGITTIILSAPIVRYTTIIHTIVLCTIVCAAMILRNVILTARL